MDKHVQTQIHNQLFAKYSENHKLSQRLEYGVEPILEQFGFDYRHRDYDLIVGSFQQKGLLSERKSGTLSLTPKGIDYANQGLLLSQIMEKNETQSLRIELLRFIEETYYSGKQLDISSLLTEKFYYFNSKSMYLLLEGMVSQNLIHKGSFGAFRNNPTATVLQVIDQGNSFFARIDEGGYRLLNPSSQQSTHTYNFEVKGPGAIINSNSTVNITNTYTKDDLSKVLPQLIEFFKDIRSEDANVLLEIYKAEQTQETSDPKLLEKGIAILTKVIGIGSALAPYLPKP